MSRDRVGNWMVLSIGVCLMLVSGCKRKPSAEPESGDAPSDVGEEVESDQIATHLKTLSSAPWLGHADDGVLVKLEFFVGASEATTVCRSNVSAPVGKARPKKSPFTATHDLSEVIWADGRSRGKYDAESQSLDVTLESTVGVHRVTLEQVTVAERPELATYSKSVPENETTLEVHNQAAEKVMNGKRWWSSGNPWTDVTVADALKEPAPGQEPILIRPDGVKPIEVPAPKPGERFTLPIICHLKPGAALPDEDGTIGVVVEMQSAGDVRSTWVLSMLNPSLQTQKLEATWVGSPEDAAPSGASSLYVYLAEPKQTADRKDVNLNAPISNLLKIEVLFTEEE